MNPGQVNQSDADMADSRYNEGMAIDAVIHALEARAGCRRGDDGWSPDEMQIAEATHRVDYVVTIGDSLYAMEHTGIEPFAGHIKMMNDNKLLFSPIIKHFDYRRDGEFWELYFPIKAPVGLKPKDVSNIQASLISWIDINAGLLPVVWFGDRFATPVLGENVPEVPFKFSLHRAKFPGYTELGGRIVLRPFVDGDLDAARQARLREACEKKFPKLAKWKRDKGAYTILVLEENDISLTNHQRVTDALELAEAGMVDTPDEVFLVSTCFSPWHVSCLRRPGATYYDDGERFHEFDQATLAPLTSQ